jgi:hypothetical protein
MTALRDSLTVVDPIDLVPRRRFSRLSEADALALAREVHEANVNQPRLRAECLARNPQWQVTA